MKTIKYREEIDEGLKGYIEKLVNTIPAEVIAAFIAIWGFIPDVERVSDGPIVALVFLILTPIYLRFYQKIKVSQVIVATISLAIWIYTLYGQQIVPGWYELWIASLLLSVWTLTIPMLFTTEFKKH